MAAFNENFNALADAQKNDLKTPEYWEKRLLGMITLLKSQMVFTNLGIEKVIPKNQGTKNYSLRRYNPLPVDLKTQLLKEGVAPDSLKIEGQKVTGTVNQYGAILKFSDVEDVIHFDDLKKEYQPELSRHAAETIERDVIKSTFAEASEHFVGGHTSIDQLTAKDVLTIRELRKIALVLRVNKRNGHTKAGGRPLVVVSPQIMQDLLDDKELLSNALHGIENTPIKNGSLRGYTIYDLTVQETLMLDPVIAGTDKTTTSKEFNVYKTVLLGKDPYAVLKLSNLSWHEVPFTAAPGNELAQVSSFGYKLWTGAKVIDPLAMHIINSRSSADFDVVNDVTDKWSRPAAQK